MTIEDKEKRLQDDIERAIKAQGLIQSMKKWDKDLVADKHPSIFTKRIVINTMVAAAVVLAVLFVPIPTESTDEYRDEAKNNATILHDMYLTAGADSADLVYQATEKMKNGEYADAYSMLCDAESALDEEFTNHSDIQYKETKKDINDLKVLCDLSRGQLFYTIRGHLNSDK